ncbi:MULTISPECIES: 2Fe-2S iron-sulfur cluster binding domain-containing protein [unclassified Variovorax]|uniref:FAD-binding oxidoreductase n=1 Tax=unclassified Variovorax TaxID=663243 RepID=UPI000838CE49|nr:MULTISPECIES: 2Fe-2S iron-sulfur cluster binding domain-containing protein [unclassified Variovorax]PNG47119.1 2-halobenzoate 1,2-dioxygenase electron transfer component [Variovorax sp. B2]PNG48230.1 2-halobenzoate 1,2-dioxygenase electron transfer component [Variovorax sp. B4]VTV14986.1 2-halobenzoate 1,2-dioxygenase electron transfer component [Variovorax sp. WDL1]
MTTTIPVTLLFSDGVSRRLQVPCGHNLVESATAAGLNLLTDCSNGQCGTCTAQLVSGEVDMQEYDPSVLPDEDRDTGVVLPCVCHVSAPCAIEFPYDSTEALTEEPAPMPAEVTAIDQVASEIVRLELAIGETVVFEPGQYVRIHPRGTEVVRSYSMANVPGTDRLEFYIRIVPGGAFSSWLDAAKVGDMVDISAPHGTFFLRHENRPRLFVAGGTGLAPFLSMLRAVAADPATQQPRTTVVIGARTHGHLIAMDELEQLRTSLPGVAIHLAVEQGDGPPAHRGYPTDLIAQLHLDADTRVYLCGPPPMVEAGRSAAESIGLPRKEVLCERFT